jgi:hypothetical protein
MRNTRLLSMILVAAGLPACGQRFDGTACIDVPEDATACPDAGDVDPDDLFVPNDCDGTKVRSISGDGVFQDIGGDVVDTANPHVGCCYDAVLVDPNPSMECMVGRPWREEGRTRLAPVRDAGAWARAGAAEHASIAAFAKLSLELMAHGAPMDLLRAVHAAALDEVDHAERCFRLAGGVVAGPFPFGATLDLRRSLAAIAADAVREGCVGETIGAVLARVAAEHAPDADVAEVLAAIADDEERHSALSWRIVAWAVRMGGEDVRAAVDAALREPAPRFDTAELAARADIDESVLVDAVADGLAAVVRPAARALLAA